MSDANTPECGGCGRVDLVPCFTGQRRPGELLLEVWWCTVCGHSMKAIGREREITKEVWDRWEANARV